MQKSAHQWGQCLVHSAMPITQCSGCLGGRGWRVATVPGVRGAIAVAHSGRGGRGSSRLLSQTDSILHTINLLKKNHHHIM